MPLYQYQCQCGLRFKASGVASKASEPKTCPTCQKKAHRLLPNQVQGQFNLKATGPTPQNTGVHDFDTHVDRVIGQSASQGMEVIEKRQAVKREMVRDGANPYMISRTPDGHYSTISNQGKALAVRMHQINAQKLKSGK